MPRNPNKRRCEVEGCRAWAMRGGTRCASHRGRQARQSAPVARSVATPMSAGELLDEELRKLLEVRARCDETHDDAGGRAPSPQFLRAWNDSVSRVVQVLRARRDLAEAQGGEFDALVRSVLDELSARLGAQHGGGEAPDVTAQNAKDA